MEKQEISKRLMMVLSDAGLMLSELEQGEDMNLMEQIEDSLQFMNLVIGIEDTFEVELPDAFLTMSNTISFHALQELLTGLLEEREQS